MLSQVRKKMHIPVIAVIVGGKVIATNFERHIAREEKKMKKVVGKQGEHLDTSELEKEHGLK